MDSRDLIEERDNLKEEILDAYNDYFDTDVSEYEDIVHDDEHDDFFSQKEISDMRARIDEIDDLENKVSSGEWGYGINFIEEDEFEDYCKELCMDCGYISKDFPTWIVIDWADTADNMRRDYSEVEFDGTTYLYRD